MLEWFRAREADASAPRTPPCVPSEDRASHLAVDAMLGDAEGQVADRDERLSLAARLVESRAGPEGGNAAKGLRAWRALQDVSARRGLHAGGLPASEGGSWSRFQALRTRDYHEVLVQPTGLTYVTRADFGCAVDIWDDTIVMICSRDEGCRILGARA